MRWACVQELVNGAVKAGLWGVLGAAGLWEPKALPATREQLIEYLEHIFQNGENAVFYRLLLRLSSSPPRVSLSASHVIRGVTGKGWLLLQEDHSGPRIHLTGHTTDNHAFLE